MDKAMDDIADKLGRRAALAGLGLASPAVVQGDQSLSTKSAAEAPYGMISGMKDGRFFSRPRTREEMLTCNEYLASHPTVRPASDPVNSPSHYTFGSIEPIDAIETWQLPFHLANVVKYVARHGKKAGATALEDLKKAEFYLSRYIKLLESTPKP